MTKPTTSYSHSTASSEPMPLTEQLLQFAAVVVVAAVVAFLGITFVEWRKRQSLPFCDPYQSESCLPCPENARCIGGDMECSSGFNRHGKFCVRDRDIEKSVKAIEEFIVQKVCGHYTLPFCKQIGPEQLTVLEATQLLENVKLVEVLSINPETFKLAGQQGLETAKNRLIRTQNVQGLLELQCPTDLLEYYKPYWCRAQEWILSHYSTLLILIPLMILPVIVLRGAYRNRKVSKRAEQLYVQVCEALEEKSRNNASGNEKWIVASHLRDHLLTLRERQYNAVWHAVEQMVCKDSRIDQYPKLVKGESKVVWEWQGKLAFLHSTK
ncbi:hypothetical protein GOP47_0001867 [Adiantum capillus-veneris]|uniref:Man1/Src1-like C-terminal domain-containing protein n=1 Tax=Adiantum capillus-veneris TaxID=13818 RepID=A0A9D4V980_ADICA|nr:hypothetical protein GOP47_0001867 [Adiantum capillus-veneris]